MFDYLFNNSDKTIFIDEKKSKNMLIEDILKVANGLQKASFKEVEIFTNGSYEFVVLLLGCLKAGLSPTLLDSELSSCGSKLLNEKVLDEFLKYEPLKPEKLSKNSSFFMLTSGSSGKQKKIEKTLDQIVKEATNLRDFFDFNDKYTFFSSVSHQHFFGLIFKIFTPLVCGAKIVSKSLKYPELIIANDCKNSVLVTSPAILKRLSEFENLNSLKPLFKIVTAGSALPISVKKAIDDKIGDKIIEIYGSTETGAVAHKKEDIFIPISHNRITINKNGGIDIKSPWCNYFHNNDEIEFKKGGFILLGRNDRIIKLEDKRVSLINIEDFLLCHEYIKDCYIDKHTDFNRLVALIVLSEKGLEVFKNSGKLGIVTELKRFLKTKYSSIFLVRNFKILSSLPINQQGKILKSAFKKALLPDTKIRWQEIEIGEKKGVFKAKTDVGLYYFTHHFPTFPLLPGFIQLGFIYELAKKININLTHNNTIQNVKFQNFSHPNDEIKVVLEVKEKKLYFEIFSDEKISSKGRFLLE